MKTDFQSAPPSPSARGNAEEGAQDPWLDALAQRICQRRLSAAAIFLFESLRPLNFIASQTLYALAPLASLFVDASDWERLARALEDRQTLEKLLDEIERKEREQSIDP